MCMRRSRDTMPARNRRASCRLKESANLARIEAVELAGTDTMKLYVFGTAGARHVNLVACSTISARVLRAPRCRTWI